ncbi:nitroreductase family deazaflavin-dependent oxidoreductase [Sphaerisporangium sp. B11E5]|uniref:nitroreductase family deazaflavin-dependent oxidoreductase n=1 Tax=Sphaerisporangium sp. B11E5 TaxID=3153563 RepID=UPI00325CB60C
MSGMPAVRRGAVARWMYRTGRPGRLARLLNNGWKHVGKLGLWPQRLVTLEVRGRRTGRPIAFPLVVADHDGERYLVSMLGENTSWVANVRAAGGHAVLWDGHPHAVRLEEVPPGLRSPILRRYLRNAPGARAHIPVNRHAPVADFSRVAADYPVFRIRAH